MEKSQTLSPYWGATDGWYCIASLGGHCSGFDNWNTAEKWAYGLDHSLNVIAKPSLMGSQTFDSSSNRRPRFNSCRNLKVRAVSVPYQYVIRSYNRATTCYAVYLWQENLPGWIYTPNISVLDWNACDGAQRRAWWAMQPRFEGEVSVLNSLFELKDFRDIARYLIRFNLGDLAKQFRRLRSTVNRSTPVPLRKSLAATRTVAEVRLVKEFAINPMIRDVTLLIEQARTCIQDKQAEFKLAGASSQISHFSEDISSSTNWTIGSSNYYWRADGSRNVVKFTACSQYLYDYKLRTDTEAFMQYYGYNLTAEAVWNAFPFSFLVDYFCKVAQAIHAMRVDPNVTHLPLQYSESLESIATVGRHLVMDPRVRVFYCPDMNQRGVGTGSLISGYEASHYQRRVTVPNKGTGLPKFSWPSTGQVKNMVALARVLW